MPLGASRLSFLAHQEATVTDTGRTAKTFITVKDPAISTDQSKFGGASAEFIGTHSSSGTSDVIRTEQHSDFIFTGDFTWECWVYFVDNSTNDGMVIMSNRGSFATHNLYVQARHLDQKWQWGNSTMGANVTTQTWNYNTWYHVAIVRSGSGSGNFALYVNGTSLQTDTDTNTIGLAGTSDYIALGAIYNATTPSFGLNGYIDEVRISPIARYTGSFTPSTTPFVNDSDTVLLAHMDGTDGTTVFRDDNGQVRSQVGVSAIGNAQIDTAQSQFGGASAVFDGSGDHLEMSTFELDGDYTVECWARWDSVVGSQGLIGSDGTTQYDTLKSSGTTVYTNFGNVFIQFDSAISTNTWYHIAVTRSGSSVRLFRDGVQQGSTATDTTTVWPNASNNKVYIGRDAYGDIDGYVDEVRISNTARYTSNFTAPTEPFENDANTLLLLHMDGTDASTTFIDDNSQIQPGLTYSGDSYASSVKLAVPFDSTHEMADVSHSLIGSTSTQATLTDGPASSLSTTQVKWSSPAYEKSYLGQTGQGAANTYALSTSIPSSSSGTFVIEGWFLASSSTSNANWCISSADSGGRFLFGINSSSSINYAAENNIGLGDSNWHHVAIVCDAGSKRVYIDGVYKQATTGGNTDWYTTNTGFSTLHLGQFNSGDGNDYQGHIQDFKVTIGSNRGYTGTSTSSANFALPRSIVLQYA